MLRTKEVGRVLLAAGGGRRRIESSCLNLPEGGSARAFTVLNSFHVQNALHKYSEM